MGRSPTGKPVRVTPKYAPRGSAFSGQASSVFPISPGICVHFADRAHEIVGQEFESASRSRSGTGDQHIVPTRTSALGQNKIRGGAHPALRPIPDYRPADLSRRREADLDNARRIVRAVPALQDQALPHGAAAAGGG